MLKSLTVALCIVSILSPASATVRSYFAPQWNGARLSACTSDGQCGKPAADAWCLAEGYERAILFQREPVKSSATPGVDTVCTTHTCVGFRQIKCFTVKDDLPHNKALTLAGGQ